MRVKILAGNWKMNKTIPEAVALAKEIAAVDFPKDRTALVFPSAVSLAAVAEVLSPRVGVGAQNLHSEAKGAFTGEIAADMILSAKAEWVLTGHSERRTLFGETDEIVAKKTKWAIQSGLKTVVCVGETLPVRESGAQNEVVGAQLEAVFALLTEQDLAQLVVAYEPVWAIGTGKTAKSSDANAMHEHLRAVTQARFGSRAADSLRILYGGSVTETNIDELMAQPHVDGALVGGASLKPASFARILNYQTGV